MPNNTGVPLELDEEMSRWLSEHGNEGCQVTMSRETYRLLQKQYGSAPRDERASKVRQQLQATVHRFLTRTAHQLAAAIRRLNVSAKLAKGSREVDLLIGQLPQTDWKSLVPDLENNLGLVAREGARLALAHLEITDQQMLSDANEVASDWAAHRAAELVGMRRLRSGRLIPNPNAQWNISDHTRDEVRRIVQQAFEEKTNMSDLADKIQQAGAFSESRAGTIASTEVIRAENQGNLLGWHQSGQVATVGVALSADHDADDECDDAADDGPYPIGDPAMPQLPLHPLCMCTYSIAQLVGQGER